MSRVKVRQPRGEAGGAATSARRLRAALGASALVAVLTACTATVEPQPDVSPPTPGTDRMSGSFPVGSRTLYLECHGTGSPTVLLESGFRDAADIWSYTDTDPVSVLSGVADVTRVCVYDRPGTIRWYDEDGAPVLTPLPSRSDPAPMPRSGLDVAEDLHALLRAANVPGPYVIAGHSLGGLFSVLFARTYPDEVVGLVLVEATSPDLEQTLGPQRWQNDIVTPLRTPSDLVPDYATETIDLPTTLDQLEATPALPREPVVMLIATELDPPGDASLLNRVRAAHRRFAATMPGARLSIVPGTSHYIQSQRPDEVISAIRGMV